MGYVVAIILAIVLIFFGAFKLWEHGEKQDLENCRAAYGIESTLGHSNANSSVKWCNAPDGTMRQLP